MVGEVRPAVVRIETSSGSGSGVIFETQGQTGYIVTNHHVVEGDARVNVTVNDSAIYSGSVLGTDAVRDLAVVSICCGSFNALPFGDATALQPGDPVVVIGYALGLPGPATVTRGIVSAVRYAPNFGSNVIQTNAAMNFGDSGGPMLSLSGKILGINTYGYDKSQTEGLNFAISGTTVQSLVLALKAAPPTPTPTPTPTRQPTPTPDAGTAGGFGPISGELRHDPADGFIKTEYTGVEFADMIVSATFVNPYSASSNSWDYGFIIRDGGAGSSARFIQIVVTSSGRWEVSWRESGSSDSQTTAQGTLRQFNTSAGGRNLVWFAAFGETGLLFVNGEFISMLDLSDVARAGDVAVITGAFEGGEVAGASTRFEDFQGWSFQREYGPVSGKLEYEQGLVSAHHSGVWTNGLVTEATFTSPSGRDWDYGFIIRNPEFNRLEVIGVAGDNRWFHQTRDVGDDHYTELEDGNLAAANLLNRNHLLLFASEEFGLFFVNGQFIARLDLSHNLDYGAVSAMGGFFNDHTGEPSFENFNVWTP